MKEELIIILSMVIIALSSVFFAIFFQKMMNTKVVTPEDITINSFVETEEGIIITLDFNGQLHDYIYED